MKIQVLFFLLLLSTYSYAQSYNYEPTAKNKYGLPNPEAPKELLDWEELIGSCNCRSVKRTSPKVWADTVEMIWRWKYIMNGFAVQDETLKADGAHSGSIRQFSSDSLTWFVHFYSNSTATPVLSAWSGNRSGDEIKLYKDQSAPNGTPGYYRILFTNITTVGFDWEGAWTSKDESIVYPTWRIFCEKSRK